MEPFQAQLLRPELQACSDMAEVTTELSDGEHVASPEKLAALASNARDDGVIVHHANAHVSEEAYEIFF